MNTLNTIISILVAYYLLMSFVLLFFGGFLIKSKETLHKYFIPLGMFYVWIRPLFVNKTKKKYENIHNIILKIGKGDLVITIT